jgi:hypothetical protein
MCCIFPYDTPVSLKQKGNLTDLNKLMNNIYKSEEIASSRIEQILIVSEENSKQTYGSLCCGKRYRRATWVGCTLSIF